MPAMLKSGDRYSVLLATTRAWLATTRMSYPMAVLKTPRTQP
jgi:hypothetical protein